MSAMPDAAVADINPAAIVDAILGFHKTAALKAAIDLELFTAIAAGDDTSERIAAKSGASERGVRILCDFLTAHGFMSKTGAHYRLTPSSQVFLDRRSPAYMGSVVDFLSAPEQLDLFLEDPVTYVRHGGSMGLANMAPDHPIWLKFAEAMIPVVVASAGGVAAEVASWPDRPRKILDIAAGHGMFGIEVAKALPDAEITAVDWAAVLELARSNAERAGVASRYRTVAGSAFDVDWGSGYDLVMLPNFLHHFDIATCARLMQKVRASLAPGGRVLAVEFVPNEDRVSPPFPAAFALVMLATTPQGDAYTASGLGEIARAAGFSGVSVRPLAHSPASLVLFEP
ncbi:class I SAM-dependent methyltransferase [Kaistia defluvii]|uniref:class I SAM-dependent methyltransferase n=1 Tax=Kaistia defluvii TaxID=410841 RepID=UPI00225559C2|nr:class I SAM-dependent methyltransferase [Kaistia defluvii]MCX5521038.1 class I SAM-dependent methyltransferase [Kaistia defluvii]